MEQGSAGPFTRPGRRLGEGPAACLLIAPALILFGVAVAYPVFETARLSALDIKGLGTPRFVGWDNYRTLFADPNFQRSLWTTLIWTLTTTAWSVGIGWGLAMLCAIAPRATLVPRMMVFSAYGLSEAVTGFVWLGIYRPDAGGLLNAGLATVGLKGLTHAWLGDPATALGALIAAYAWAQAGLPLMLCFASTQGIPTSVIEAASIDGARPLSLMRYIIVPLSLPGLRVAVFINLLGSLRAFDTIYILTGGGPLRSTETVGFFLYRESMTQFKLGYGAAATIVLLVAVLVVSTPVILQRTASVR